jgi:hypothetical protein|tara:strand:+ start:131 stop:271 length:141 start_codon:yes stop_codon:yes gene_type:complete
MNDKTENVVEVNVTGVSGKVGVGDDSDRSSENDKGKPSGSENDNSE